MFVELFPGYAFIFRGDKRRQVNLSHFVLVTEITGCFQHLKNTVASSFFW